MTFESGVSLMFTFAVSLTPLLVAVIVVPVLVSYIYNNVVERGR